MAMEKVSHFVEGQKGERVVVVVGTLLPSESRKVVDQHLQVVGNVTGELGCE